MKIKVLIMLFLVVFIISCDTFPCLRNFYIDSIKVSYNNEIYKIYVDRAVVTDIYKKVPCEVDKVVIEEIETFYANETIIDKKIGDTIRVNEKDSITIRRKYNTSGEKSCIDEEIYDILIESESCSGNGLVLGKKIAYKDNVSGYTIKQIEDALYNQKTWLQWRNNLKNKFNNSTEKHVDAAFHYWGNE